jgi:small ligand-binding sensory domain FIST
MAFASALSTHPVITTAVGEVIGAILEQVGPQPDLVVLFVTSPVVGALDDVVRTITTVLEPGRLIGTAASAILVGGIGVEDAPAIALWAGSFSQEVRGVRLTARQSPEGWLFDGLPNDIDSSGESLIMLADPFSFPGDEFLQDISHQYPRLRISGGFSSAARNPGGNRLVLDDSVFPTGAVGVLVPAPASTVVSQGCRPIGQPFIVTKSDRNVIYELAGRPAYDRLMEMIDGLNTEDRLLAGQGLHCGLVVDEHKAEFDRGDFLVRGVMGGDKSVGAVVIGDEVPVGATVQFQVRDPESAGPDLSTMLTTVRADAALVFTCNGRGSFMFGTPNHDAEIIDDALLSNGPSRPAVAGMFCAGEIGPVGSRNALHGFTASLALFNDHARTSPQPA